MSFNSNIRECESDESCGLSPIRKIAIFALIAVGVFFSLKATTQRVSASVAASTSPVTVTKNIEDIQVGDLVLSRDEHGTTIAPRPVKEVYRRTSYHLRNLTFRDDAGNEQTLQTTDEHPFWSVTDNEFVDAGKLQLGAKVTSPNGYLQTLVATSRDDRSDAVPVFNFQVDAFHTYYVENGASSDAILVHNADKGYERLGDLNPIDTVTHKAPRPHMQELSDKDLMTWVTNPHDDRYVTINTRLGELSDGNGRVNEMQARMLDGNSAFTPDTLIPVEYYTPDMSWLMDPN